VQTLQLQSMRVRLGTPVRVVQGVGHIWFPVIHKFANGELIAQWSLMPDIHCFAYLAGASHSTDNGKTWSKPYSFGNFANQCIPLPDGSLRRLPYYIYPSPPNQKRRFTTDLSTVWPGGRNEMVPHGATITFPRDVEITATDAAMMNFTGAPLQLGDRWIATTYGCWDDDPRAKDRHFCCVHILETHDLGKTWTYLSTVARHDQTPEPTPTGPSEACMVQLDNGQILCIYRVGHTVNFKYQASRSDDGGKTWSKPEILDGPHSVEPSIKRTANNTLIISGGRPSLNLWLADDGIGKTWHHVDLRTHHNNVCMPEERIAAEPTQSTYYTELLEIAPNKLLCIYDRCPLGWEPVPLESPERNMIFAIEIEVER